MWDSVVNIATVIGGASALSALFFMSWQLQKSSKQAEGSFLLELEKLSERFDDIQAKLRPGGEWASGQSCPNNVVDWAKIDDYLGFFEHCEILMRKGVLKEKDFKNFYSYRLHNVMQVPCIRDKICQEVDSWKLLIEAYKRVGGENFCK